MYIRQCEQCLQFKAKPTKMPLYPIVTTYPSQLVHMDYLAIESPKGGKDMNILIITDHFTPYAQAIVTCLQTAKVTAQALWN